MASNVNIVKLNIGGTVFQTSKSTLTRYKGFFSTILETEVPIAKDDSGCIFIDRDPTHFRSILNFMRDGHVATSGSVKELEKIRNEAQYYLLNGLVELCVGELKKRSDEIKKKISPFGEDVQVIDTHGQMLQLMVKDFEKPLLIIYYLVDDNGQTVRPHGFHIKSFLDRFKHKLDIYFKSRFSKEVTAEAKYNIYNRWTWSLHYCGENSHGFPKCKEYGGYDENNPFTVQLENAINEFFTENDIPQ